MELNAILKGVNAKLAGEQLSYEDIKPHLDDVIDTINSTLSTKFPAFSEFTAAAYPQYPNYNFFPDKYIRSVVCLGAARNFYITDEEGALSVPAYEQQFQHNLFLMLRDYSELVPEEYRDYDRGALIDPNHTKAPSPSPSPSPGGTTPDHGSLDATLTITGREKPTKVIPAGYTSGGTITAQLSAALAHKIQAGETIGGVTGTLEVPLMTGNATPADLLAGKTAITDNGLITGTMPNNGNQTAILIITGSEKPTKVIPAGYTIGGTITVQLDSSLASSIKSGVTIGGVTGTFQGGKRMARFTIGTTQNGWTAEDCDYLCDGTDDQEEIIQALNDLPETGGEVVILDGTYNITASINIPKNNVSLRGNGNATILKRMYDSTSTNSGPTAKGLITLNGKSGCKIQGLQINGNKAIYTENYNGGIFLYSSSNNTITGNTCNNNSYGIDLDIFSYYNTITDNTCNINNSGINLNSVNSNTITGNTCNSNNNYGIGLYDSKINTITGNICNSNDVSGIYLDRSSNSNTITGNICDNNDDYGIHLYAAGTNTISDNICTYNSYGIDLDTSSNNTITGNTCNKNNYGIDLDLSSNNTITGNTCNNNSYGIDLDISSNNTITGNTCNKNNSYGIHLYSYSSKNTVTGNTCIRGTGTPEDYTTDQYTILLSGTSNDYNFISSNNCMGKAVVVEGGTGNSVWGNKFDDTDDLPLNEEPGDTDGN